MTQPKITEEAKAEAERRWNENYVRIFTALEARNGSHTTTAIDVGKEILAAHIQTTSDVAKEINGNIERQRVSHGWCPDYLVPAQERLQSLILPDPKDPLAESMREVFPTIGDMRDRCVKPSPSADCKSHRSKGASDELFHLQLRIGGLPSEWLHQSPVRPAASLAPRRHHRFQRARLHLPADKRTDMPEPGLPAQTDQRIRARRQDHIRIGGWGMGRRGRAVSSDLIGNPGFMLEVLGVLIERAGGSITIKVGDVLPPFSLDATVYEDGDENLLHLELVKDTGGTA